MSVTTAIGPAPPPEDPGLWSQIMSNGIMGMPVSDALLRFGSGLLAGDGWNEGLSRAGANLVQGSQQARAQQLAQLQAHQRFQQQKALQDERIAAQERIAGAQLLMRNPNQGRYPNQGDVMVDPSTGLNYSRAWDTHTGRPTYMGPNGEPITDQAIIGRLRWSRAQQPGADRLLADDMKAWDEFLGAGAAAENAPNLAATLRQIAQVPAGGPDLPSRFGELASRFGIQIPGLGPNTTVQQLRDFWFTEANQQAFRQRIQGLAPISNVDLQQAMNGLLSGTSTPQSVLAVADRLERDAQTYVGDRAAALERFGDPAARRRLFEQGEFRVFLDDRRTQRTVERLRNPQPAFTTTPGDRTADPVLRGQATPPPAAPPAGGGNGTPRFSVRPPGAPAPAQAAPAPAAPPPAPPSPAAAPGTNPTPAQLGMPTQSPAPQPPTSAELGIDTSTPAGRLRYMRARQEWYDRHGGGQR